MKLFSVVAGFVCFLSLSLAGGKPLAVQFVVQALPEGAEEFRLSDGRQVSEPFRLNIHGVSSAIKVGTRQLILENRNNGSELTSIALPEEGEEFVVFLYLANDGEARPMKSSVLSLPGDFRPGTYFFINRTAEKIECDFGDGEVSIGPGAEALLKPRLGDGKSTLNVEIHSVPLTEEGEEGAQKPLSRTRWPLTRTTRSYVFFTQNAAGTIDFRAVDEFVEEN
ncbi:hypothetical protein [Roseibacillus ishigakijimensis]|uniref:Uncharacterized protein n=1 Tax=Roseibacillus ishigakijimensis TaxID=454146 RepID=A0A934RLR8_9BACT|nr:hypothetical protein [Roseibacillus ishigakijimensis]MBK1833168.1 hypothetical protein [Roseibacillus ishigakijimensis]